MSILNLLLYVMLKGFTIFIFTLTEDRSTAAGLGLASGSAAVAGAGAGSAFFGGSGFLTSFLGAIV